MGGSSGRGGRGGGSVWRRKTLAEFESEDALAHEEASMGLFDLLCIGIGGTVGSGVFVLTGEVFPVAGPAASVCWMLGGVVCMLSALSYMELSARIPTRGSTYAYSYHALGEIAAVAGATSLTLEYGLSGAGVARSWSVKFAALVDVSWVRYFYRPYSGEGRVENLGEAKDNYLDLMAALLQIVCALIVANGFNLSKRVVNTMTVLKVALVLFLIVAGFAGTGRDVFSSTDEFFPEGVSGVATGTSLLFFGFIGFDEVCCMAARSKNPRVAMPRAIAGTLLGAALLSTLAQLALAGLTPDADDDDDGTSFEVAFRHKGWKWAKYTAQVGEVLLLPLVVLLSFMPQPELMAALGKDGVVSSRFAKLEGDVYTFGCAACGVVLTAVSMIVPFDVLWNTINLGVLVGFNLSNSSLISVRCGNGGVRQHRPAEILVLAYVCLVAPAAAYLLWKGALQPCVDDKSFGPLRSDRTAQLGLGFGLFFLALAGFTLRLLARFVADAASSPERNHSNIRSPSTDLTRLGVDDDDFGGLSTSPPPSPSDRPSAKGLFKAPGVPYVPGLAIFLNYLLMAQYAWIDHLYFIALYLVAYLGYFLNNRHRRTFRKLGRDSSSDSSSASDNPLHEDDDPAFGGATSDAARGADLLARPLLDHPSTL